MATPEPAGSPGERRERRTIPETSLRQWSVVLHREETDPPARYVPDMLQEVLRYTEPVATELAALLSRSGRVVCYVAHQELAELKCELLLDYGTARACGGLEPLVAAYIEPAAD